MQMAGTLTVRQALALVRKMEREDVGVRFVGLRRYSREQVGVDCEDTRYGVLFTVWSDEDWDDRVRAAGWPAVEE